MSTKLSEIGRIEEGLDATREKLSTHIAELQDRLSPGQVLDEAMTYFRGKQGAEFGRSLMENVRANPLPVAVSGIGLAWLMASSPRGGTTAPANAPRGTSRVQVYHGSPDFGLDSHAAMTARIRGAEQGIMHEAGEPGHVHAARLDVARGEAIGVVREANDTQASYSQRIRDTLDAAQQAAGRGAHDLRDQVGGMASFVGTSMQGAAHSVGDAAQRSRNGVAQGGHAAGSIAATLAGSPVLLGALGLAAGALLGALLPQSDQEEDALGGLAAQARQTARGLAQRAADTGGDVAQTVIDQGRDSAQTHGLTDGKSPGNLLDDAMSGKLADDARQVASDVLHAGDEAVRHGALGAAPDPARSH